MDISTHGHMVVSALRIYLAQTLQQSEDLLTRYQLRFNISITETEQSSWHKVQQCAQTVIRFIKNCKKDDEVHGFSLVVIHGLSAIDAAQDALTYAVLHAQRYHLDSHRLQNMHFEDMSEQNLFRARCTVHGILAVHNRDQELAGLWVQAAQLVLQKSQFKRTNSCAWNSITRINEFSTIAMPRYSGLRAGNLPEDIFHARAARCNSLVAVYAVLGRTTTYHLAAGNYLTAAHHCVRARRAPPETAILWERAISLLRLAGEQFEAQALHELSDISPSAGVDPEALTLQANALVQDAEQARSYLNALNALKTKHAHTVSQITKCKVACVVPLRRILAVLQGQTCVLWEQYLQKVFAGESNSAAAEDLLKQYQANHAETDTLTSVMTELELQINAVDFYKSQVAHCTHVANAELRALWRKCWSRAADFTTGSINMSAKMVQHGVFVPLPPAMENTRRLHYLKARMYAHCATNMITVAEEYLTAAQTAQSAEHDPRETTWWRAAADSQMYATVQRVDEIRHFNKTVGPRTLTVEVSDQARVSFEEATMYASAAGYLRRAAQCSLQSHQLPHAARVAELYSLVADLAFDGAGTVPSFGQRECERGISSMLKLIDHLSGVKQLTTAFEVDVLERACTYARNSFEARRKENIETAETWMKAVNILFHAFTFQREHIEIAWTCAALYARSVQTSTLEDPRESQFTRYVADILAKAFEQALWHRVISDYCIILAKFLCADVCRRHNYDYPEELQRIVDVRDDKLDNVWREHEPVCVAELECIYHISLSSTTPAARCAWQQARGVTKVLFKRYTNLVTQPHARSPDYCALQKVSLQCLLAAARSGTSIWDEAAAMCRVAQGASSRFSEQTAIVAIKHHMSAAEARAGGDTELAMLWTAAARAARRVMESESAAPTTQEMCGYQLKEATQRVLCVQANRNGHVELAQLHAEMANLLQKLADSLFQPDGTQSPVTTWMQSAKRQIGLLEVKVDKMMATHNDDDFVAQY